ncbi:hypothetical protein QBC43DRAFT_347009 [Cladorrhinum sp. PSN259]|nr:hypothetical protein QBC43DRAFT_347009 [Cladorrhinum sp. PSN259]
MASSQPKNSTNLEGHFKAVSEALTVQANKTTFAVGGLIHVPLGNLTLRWDADETNHCRKAWFPADSSNPASIEAFTKFIEDSEPATYGVGNEKVYDETYRKAGTMSADRFSTSFNLSEWGIMEAVSQALVHGPHGGIKAELYNVNVYSGPSGKFKPHVDTPRSKDQMGSLVVCLPSPHQGGQLAVRHQGREVIFDWAGNSSVDTAVQWAAFFSDCEHEVLQVTSGHRITLTYNLYWTPQVSRRLEAIQPEQLSFFPALKNLLDCPEFLPEGGFIGFTCAHAYPHRSKAMGDILHDNLKGIDMLVYQALQRLTGPRGNVRVTDVVDMSELDEYWRGAEEDRPSLRDPAVGNLALEGPCMSEYCDDDGDATDISNYTAWDEKTRNWAPYFSRRAVHWLNRRPNEKEDNQEMAIAYLTYGNQPGMGCLYSSAVIVAEIKREPHEEEAMTEKTAKE